MKTTALIMAGGRGERFWPKSRKSTPKQFLNLADPEKTMIQSTVERILPLVKAEDILIATNKDYRDLVREQLPALPEDNILREPLGRNTAPCIGWGAVTVRKRYGDALMMVLPSDHLIQQPALFRGALKTALRTAEETDALVTLGISPTVPDTGYGYIKYNADDDNVAKKVYEFVEKPDLETASEYVDSGEYAWNSGMFIWKASTILKYFEKLLPDIYRYLVRIGDAMGTDREQQVLDELYPEIPKISIDYGIMERAEGVLMLEGDFGWNDVGSFDAFDQIHERDVDGNVILSDVSLIDCDDSVFYSTQKGHLIAALGIKDIVVAHTDDVTLVCAKDRAQDIKLFADKLKEEGKERYC